MQFTIRFFNKFVVGYLTLILVEMIEVGTYLYFVYNKEKLVYTWRKYANLALQYVHLKLTVIHFGLKLRRKKRLVWNQIHYKHM